MTVDDIVLFARTYVLDDAVLPYLWSDIELLDYANDAEQEACRRASLLIDESTAQDADAVPLCTLAVVAGTSLYTISKKILRVRTAIPAVNNVALMQKTENWLDEFYPNWREDTGTPVYFVQDKDWIRFVPEPVADDTVTLNVIRFPLADMALAQGPPEDSPEIPEEYHRDLTDWIAHRAYNKQDAETQDLLKSQIFEDRFERKFGPKLSAITESNRRRKPRNMGLRIKEFGFS